MAEPKHKGVGVLPVVQGLKGNPAASARVPEPLKHYLTTPILPSAWYPEKDYHVLIEVLANSVDPKAVGGDVWGFFGRSGAQRDIAGSQDDIPKRSRTENAGIYRRFRDNDDDAGAFFLRVTKIWSLYHDSGHQVLCRSREDPAVAIIRLFNFRFPSRGMVELQTAYVVEYARLIKLAITGRIARSVSEGAPFYEWHYRVEPTEAHLSSMAVVPLDDR